ncbi:MAG: DUF1570 domain-containing protein [Kiritimatiellae bacterium]|nr:DUF1570 domain-containing protein [Kiritimatiellia bacterium]
MFIFIVLVLTVLRSAQAAVPAFERARNYPHIGLALPSLSQAQPRPLPMPEAHAYLAVDLELLEREDRFAPFDLWFHDACEGRWQDASGNMLTIGRIKTRLPGFSEEHVTRERFAIESANSVYQIDSRKQEQIHEWVATFCNAELSEPEALNINSIALSTVYAYTCAMSNTLVYSFHPRRIGNARNFEWFCVILQLVDIEDLQAFQLDFESNYIAKITQPPATSKREGITSTELETSRKGKTDFNQPNHPVRVAARKSVRNYEEWWLAETDGYIILSDVNTELGKSLIQRLQREMPLLHAAYRALVPPLTETDDISLIRIFQSKRDYNQYVGEGQEWSGGMWMPQRRELVLTQEFNTEEIMRTIRHEAFHQYLSYAYCMITPPPWMNEGHACLFEAARIDSKGKVMIEEDEKRCNLLLENLELATALIPVMLDLSYSEFYGGTPADRSLSYALAWGIAYYLQKGAPLERNTPFKELLHDSATALVATRNYQEATALAFIDLDMKVFQDNFKDFWLKRRATAMRYDPLKK